MTALIWDKTLAWNAWFRDVVTLQRLKRAGYGVVGLTVGGGSGGRQEAVQGLRAVSEWVDRHPADYRIVRCVDDVDAARHNGQLALELNFQGAEPLEGRLEAIEEFWQLGVRQIGIVWNADSGVGCSATSPVDSGLTAFGRRMVAEMNRAGIIVDGAHAGHRTSMEAMQVCAAPFVFSHANVAALEPSYKNLQDDQIVACAHSGGVIGVSGFGTYLDDPQVPAPAMFRQIDYLCELAGPHSVGLGLDFLRDPAPLWDKVRSHPQLWPGVRESRFFPPEEIAELQTLMTNAGYSAGQVAGILGENWRRVSDRIWAQRREPAHG